MTDFDTSPIIIEDSAPPSVRGERLTGRFGMVSLVGASLRSEAGIRDAIAQLTAWLDAPRLAARKPISACAVIDVDYSTGVALIKSKAGEWGVIDSDGLSHAPGWLDAPGILHDWYATEAEGRAAYRGETGKVSCESCAKFIDHDAATVDDEGIYTCANLSTCGAGIITEATP